MRIVFFGVDGVLSPPALSAIATEHQLVGVVRAAPAAGAAPPRFTPRRLLGAAARALGLRRPGSLADLARSQKAPLWEARTGDDPDIDAAVRRARPDVICIAGYPWLLRGEMLVSPRLKNPKVPKGISDVVLKAMAPEIHARYQRAGELLDDVLANRGKTLRPTPRPAPTPEGAESSDIKARVKAAREAPQPRFCWHCRKPLQARSDRCPFCGEKQ